ncbi:hypothetical protein [Microbacterium amylolyticum]|uniref:Uncharacterized protein n=1 Tax=Microbacterium amylolyticum TaxID=936337 RepID=A0ABS4ZHK8_9MICO|nr:hypothetical protein [Microbacterium amylolyticum]MBP2436767.1 hypothetical protein [Microbacterium amylolyticum]
MIITGIVLITLAVTSLGATAILGPRDGYGMRRHGTDDWPHGPC